MLQWHHDFAVEVGEPFGLNPGEGDRWFANQLKHGTAFIWQDGSPVSLACMAVKTGRIACINMVYTPSAFRNQGYASSCVAALSQLLLAQGAEACCLFTDLANLTSNKIYRAIGYKPVEDWNQFTFKH